MNTKTEIKLHACIRPPTYTMENMTKNKMRTQEATRAYVLTPTIKPDNTMIFRAITQEGESGQ
jgi:hypothetical protein